MLELFLKAAFIGLSIAAPVGPIGLLCIQRTLDHGRRVGLATGLGAAVADAVYGAVGALGLTAILALLVGARLWLAIGGGAFLLYLGATTWLQARRVPASAAAAAAAPGVWSAFLTTFVLTLSNPMTILSFIAVFASLASTQASLSAGAQATMVLGVLVGSALWWLVLSGGVSMFHRRVGEPTMVLIRRASGLLVAGFGLYQLWSVFAG